MIRLLKIAGSHAGQCTATKFKTRKYQPIDLAGRFINLLNS